MVGRTFFMCIIFSKLHLEVTHCPQLSLTPLSPVQAHIPILPWGSLPRPFLPDPFQSLNSGQLILGPCLPAFPFGPSQNLLLECKFEVLRAHPRKASVFQKVCGKLELKSLFWCALILQSIHSVLTIYNFIILFPVNLLKYVVHIRTMKNVRTLWSCGFTSNYLSDGSKRRPTQTWCIRIFSAVFVHPSKNETK